MGQIDESQVVLFAPFDADVNGDIVLEDLSANNVTFTKSGNANATGDIVANTNNYKFGNAAGSFNTASYILSAPAGYESTESQSVLAWVYFNNVGATQTIIQADNAAGSTNGTQLLRDHLPNMATETNINTRISRGFNSNNDVTVAGQWYHVAVVNDREDTSDPTNFPNGKVFLYVNGVLVPGAGVSEADTNNADLILGSRRQQNAEFFDGLLDDLLITTEKLNATQIQDIMNNGVQLYQNTLTYNTTWDSDPNASGAFFGPRTNLNIQAGTAVLSDNVSVNNINVASGAGLETTSVINVYGNINNAGEFTFKSTASANGELGPVISTQSNITGNYNVERYYQNNRAYRMVSSAVTTAESIYDSWQEGGLNTNGVGTHITGSTSGANGFDATTSGNPSLFFVDQASQAFTPIPNTNATTLNANESYLLYVRGDRANVNLMDNNSSSETTLVATGSLAVGTQTQTYNVANANDFVMFGNPYQASVNINNVLANTATSPNLNGSQYYIYDPTAAPGDNNGAYVLVDLVSGTTTESLEFLQPGQAAQIQVNTAGSTDIVFEENDKATGNFNTTFLLPQELPFPTIVGELFTTENFVAQNSQHDKFTVVFNNQFSNNIDNNDAKKAFNIGENMFVTNGDNNIALERRTSLSDDDVIQLSNTNYNHNEYTIKLSLNDFESSNLIFRDSFTGNNTPLDNGETIISFNVFDDQPNSKATDRFSITTDNILATTDVKLETNFIIYPNPIANENLNITVGSQLLGEKVTFTVYNMLGQKILESEKTLNSNRAEVSTQSLSGGIYIIKMNADDNVQFTQQFIKK